MYIVPVDVASAFLQVLPHIEVGIIEGGFLEATDVDDFCSLRDFLWQALFRCLLLEALCVDMRQDVTHLLEVAIGDHPVRLIEDQHINHRKSIEQV